MRFRCRQMAQNLHSGGLVGAAGSTPSGPRRVPTFVAMRSACAALLVCLALSASAASSLAMTPNDPAFDREWGPRLTHASSLWDRTTGDRRIVIAVIDTGVAPIPELRAALVPGWDFVDGDATPQDTFGHGTWVASAIAAQGNNRSLRRRLLLGLWPDAGSRLGRSRGGGHRGDRTRDQMGCRSRCARHHDQPDRAGGRSSGTRGRRVRRGAQCPRRRVGGQLGRRRDRVPGGISERALRRRHRSARPALSLVDARGLGLPRCAGMRDRGARGDRGRRRVRLVVRAACGRRNRRPAAFAGPEPQCSPNRQRPP